MNLHKLLARHDEMKELKHIEKVTLAKFDQLKKLTIQEALFEREEVIGPEGLILFTYKTSTPIRIDTTRLQKEMPEIAKQFEVISEVKTFRIIN